MDEIRKFDLTSDLHTDFWVGINGSPKKQERTMHTLVQKLIPLSPSNTLVVAGDIGHYNHQNVMMMKVLRQYYKDVVLVHGNHDLYMVSPSVMKKFSFNSFTRLADFMKSCESIPGVHFLHGQNVSIDGILFAGAGAWYDNSYGRNRFFASDRAIDAKWETYMNDFNYILARPGNFDRHAYMKEQYDLLDKVIDGADVVVTHICPSAEFFPPHYDILSSTFYQFDGSAMLSRLSSSAVWCYGHAHEQRLDIHRLGCRVLCNPLGYPENSVGRNWWTDDFPESRKILTIEVGGEVPSYDKLFGANDESIP